MARIIRQMLLKIENHTLSKQQQQTHAQNLFNNKMKGFQRCVYRKSERKKKKIKMNSFLVFREQFILEQGDTLF